MRIGELATRTGASVRALRYYEEQKLLVAGRSTSGQRHYTDAAVARVALVQQLYSAGLSSRTIRRVLPCVDRPDLVNNAHSHDLLLTERDRIEAQITSLIGTRDTLNDVIVAANACMAPTASR